MSLPAGVQGVENKMAKQMGNDKRFTGTYDHIWDSGLTISLLTICEEQNMGTNHVLFGDKERLLKGSLVHSY